MVNARPPLSPILHRYGQGLHESAADVQAWQDRIAWYRPDSVTEPARCSMVVLGRPVCLCSGCSAVRGEANAHVWRSRHRWPAQEGRNAP